MVRGLWYSVPILAILGCHELGHYFACRYYGVAASCPYFLPMPLVLTGTLGAFIRIRQPIPGKRELFDIGIAGPIAGFVIAVPLLFMGMYLSRVVELPRNFEGELFWLGEPLLFKAAAWLTFGHVADGLHDHHASGGIRGVVRPAGNGAQPVSDRAARRRPHLLRRPRAARARP